MRCVLGLYAESVIITAISPKYLARMERYTCSNGFLLPSERRRRFPWYVLRFSHDSLSVNSSQEQLKAVQTDIEESMIKIVSAAEPYPLPGRPVRRLVASCLKTLYMRGETKSLFDTIQAFLKLLAETKPPAKESSRL